MSQASGSAMTGTDAAFINRTIGQVYTDLGYLVDVGVISDADYDLITSKIPRRYKGNASTLPDVGSLSVTPSQNSSLPLPVSQNEGRKVPPTPARDPSPGPPAYTGIGQAEALYDFPGTDSGDLGFRTGEQIVILEYVNNDWWKGMCNGREGLFPSNYVKKTSDTGKPLEKVPYEQAMQYPTLVPGQYNPQQYVPVQYAPAPQAHQTDYSPGASSQPPQQPVTVVQDKKSGKMHSIGGKLGNAALWGAGATFGSNIVNAIL